MWIQVIAFLIRYVLLPALGIVPATMLAMREIDTTEIQAFAATGAGGNFLLWMLVIGLTINALVNANIPQVQVFKAWLLKIIAEKLAAMANKIKPEGV